MGYGRYNKEFDLTPRYADIMSVQQEQDTTESVDIFEHAPLPEAPGASQLWTKAIETARERYPRPQNYHETVRATAAQKAARIPYLLQRANITSEGDNNRGLHEATQLLEKTNIANHIQGLITFLGHGVIPAYVRPEAVEIAVTAAKLQLDAETATQLSDAYTFWQQITGYTALANMVKTE